MVRTMRTIETVRTERVVRTVRIIWTSELETIFHVSQVLELRLREGVRAVAFKGSPSL